MDRKDEHSKNLLSQVNSLIENNKILEVRELIEEYHCKEAIEKIVDIIENKKNKKEILMIRQAFIEKRGRKEFFTYDTMKNYFLMNLWTTVK